MLGGLLLLAQLSIAVEAPDTIGACAPLTVIVELRAPGTEAPRLVLPDFRPFALVQSSARPRIETDARRAVWVADQHRFVISASRPGTYVIPPFVARLGGESVRSRPTRVTVVPPELGGGPAIVTRAPIDHGRPVHFRAMAVPDTVYVGQQVTYQAAAFLEDSVQGRLRRNPEFFPPEMRAMLAYDLPFVRGYLPRRQRSNRCYEVPVFQRAIFPLMAGRHALPPAQLVYTLPRSHSFFSREESHELKTDSVVVVAIEPPAAGRPADFAGAVGTFRIRATVDSTDARVGVPLVLTVRVEGEGNMKLLPRPALSIPWASLVPSNERVEVGGEEKIGGSKEFDWVLTPHQAGSLVIPEVRYPFFDPGRAEYEVALSSPVMVSIAPGTIAAADTGAGATPPLAIRERYRGALAEPVHERPAFWVLLFAAPLPALVLALIRMPRRPARPKSAAQRLRVLARNPQHAGARAVRRAFVAALSERLALPALAMTRRGALVRALRKNGVSPSVAAEAEAFLVSLDHAAFGRGSARVADAAMRACRIHDAVDREALRRRPTPPTRRGARASLGVVLTLLAGASALHARGAAESAADQFARGAALYEARAWPAAARAFGTAARLEPRAADAWANFGTAAWAAGDTVDALIGWHRALRLEPLAADARERLATIHAAIPGEIDAVPEVPASALAIGAAVLWIAGSIFLFAFVRGGAPAAAGLGRVAMLSALALAAVAWQVDRRVDGEELVVAVAAAPLRVIPALGGESTSAIPRGEVMRRSEMRGAWVRVHTTDERAGWVESERLVPLVHD